MERRRRPAHDGPGRRAAELNFPHGRFRPFAGFVGKRRAGFHGCPADRAPRPGNVPVPGRGTNPGGRPVTPRPSPPRGNPPGPSIRSESPDGRRHRPPSVRLLLRRRGEPSTPPGTCPWDEKRRPGARPMPIPGIPHVWAGPVSPWPVHPVARLPGSGSAFLAAHAAIPLILRELEKEPAHWFPALKKLSGGQDPVPADRRGDVEAMRRAWLAWGRDQGFLT